MKPFFLRATSFIWVGVIFCALPSSAYATNEFEVLVNSVMPVLQERHLEMLARKAPKSEELTIYRGSLTQIVMEKNELIELGQWTSLQEQEYQVRCDEYDAVLGKLYREIDDILWDFMLSHVIQYAKAYAWAIPNDEAIAAIKEFGPIIEIGAGSGYWAHLLSQSGVRVVAYDDGSFNSHDQYQYTRQWFEVQKGDEMAILQHPDKTLMLCWPPGWNEMASNALRVYQGQFVVYVGEPAKIGSSGTPAFFGVLERDFDLIQTVKIPNWPGYTDQVFIYQRKKPADPPFTSAI